MTMHDNTIPQECDVAIVGGGTAGLALAAELKRLGVSRVVVLEREKVAGGIPRHCGHYPFGIREYRRLMKGPDYARRNVETAAELGAEIYTQVTVTVVHPRARLSLSSPQGQSEIQARRVVLCTGVRESSRSQRFIGGDRPLGIMNTGALQSMVYLHRLCPFRRPAILGSELVSFSAIETCRHLGIRPVAMVEDQDRIIARRMFQPYPQLRGVPLFLKARDLRIIGGPRVEAITFTDAAGTAREIETDGVIVSGHFRPEAAFLRSSHLELDPGSGGPVVDQYGQCSDPSYYSAGNLLRPAESSGWCWREGIETAHRIVRDLAGGIAPPARQVRLQSSNPAIGFIVPQRLTIVDRPGAMDKMRIGLNVPVRGGIRAVSGGKTLWQGRINARPVRRTLLPLTSILHHRPDAPVFLSTEENS